MPDFATRKITRSLILTNPQYSIASLFPRGRAPKNKNSRKNSTSPASSLFRAAGARPSKVSRSILDDSPVFFFRAPRMIESIFNLDWCRAETDATRPSDFNECVACDVLRAVSREIGGIGSARGCWIFRLIGSVVGWSVWFVALILPFDRCVGFCYFG